MNLKPELKSLSIHTHPGIMMPGAAPQRKLYVRRIVIATKTTAITMGLPDLSGSRDTATRPVGPQFDD